MPNLPKLKKSVNYSYYTDVLWCCVPLTAMSCYYYGARPLLLLLTALITAYLCDCLVAPLHGEGYRPREWSSECFGALIALMMPATVPYGILVISVVVAILAKETFGGEGHYPFHPAAVGLAVAAVSWPDILFRYPAPGTQLPLLDSYSGMPLTAGMNATLQAGGLPSASTVNLLTGNVAGPMGTGAVLVMLACALLLLCRGHLRLSVLIPYLIVLVALPWLLPHLNELPTLSAPWEYVRQRIYLEKYILLSGTSLFGGIFLASEPVTCPNRLTSRIIYGLALGGVAVAFRYFSVYETGICFALLIVQAFPEWLDRVGRRAERIRFREKEAQQRGKHELE